MQFSQISRLVLLALSSILSSLPAKAQPDPYPSPATPSSTPTTHAETEVDLYSIESLSAAIRSSDVSFLSHFFQSRGNSNIQDPQTGNTLLHIAILESKEPHTIVSFLLSHGTKPSLINDQGQTPLSLARQRAQDLRNALRQSPPASLPRKSLAAIHAHLQSLEQTITLLEGPSPSSAAPTPTPALSSPRSSTIPSAAPTNTSSSPNPTKKMLALPPRRIPNPGRRSASSSSSITAISLHSRL